MKERTKLLLLILITLIVYIPALRAGYIWDDGNAVLFNPLLHTPEGLWKIWTNPSSNTSEDHYWPMVYTTFWMEYQLWRNQPFGYHLVNILLHIVNSILIWQLLRRMSIPGSWFSALIFALHPVHVESVAWIVERKDLLSGFFYLLSFSFFLQFNGTQNKTKYIFSLFFFILALLSKSIVVTFPFVLLLILWWKKDRIANKDLFSVVPYLIFAGIYAYIDLTFYHQNNTMHFPYSFLQRCMIAGQSLWFYFWKLIVPWNLITIYPKWDVNIITFGKYLYSFGILLIVGLLWKKRTEWGKGPLVAVLFFILTLSPVLGFLDFGFMDYSFVADRFQYLASLGLIALFSAVFLTRIPYSFFRNSFPALILCILGILTFHQSLFYKDMESLFRYNISKNPNAWVAHYNLATALDKQGKYDEALLSLSHALQLNPQSAIVHNRLGVILAEQKKYPEALDHFYQAFHENPNYMKSSNNIGVVMFLLGKKTEAKSFFTKTIENRTVLPEPYFNLGILFYGDDNYEDALNCFKSSVQLSPELAIGHNNLGVCYFQMGDQGRGIAHISRATRLKSDYLLAQNNLKQVLDIFQKKSGKADLHLENFPQLAR